MNGRTPPAAPVARWWDELIAATILGTRLPIRRHGTWPDDLNARCLRAFPIVGLALGLGAGGLYWLGTGLGLPNMLSAALAIAGLALTTGAMHEDGLADVCDGIGGGHDMASKLAIMRDSRVGTYGVLALVFSVTLRVMALAAIGDPWAALAALAASETVSRSLVVAMAAWLPPARRDGLATSHLGVQTAWLTVPTVLAALVAIIGLGFGAGIAALAVSSLAVFVLARLARRHLGGQTGDVLGAAQQLASIAVLLVAAAAKG